MKMQGFVVVALLSMSACAHTVMAPQGGEIVMLRARVPQDCVDLGRVEGLAQGSFLYGDVLNDEAEALMRNDAASVGATHVRLLEVHPSAHESKTYGQAYRCEAGATLR